MPAKTFHLKRVLAKSDTLFFLVAAFLEEPPAYMLYCNPVEGEKEMKGEFCERRLLRAFSFYRHLYPLQRIHPAGMSHRVDLTGWRFQYKTFLEPASAKTTGLLRCTGKTVRRLLPELLEH